MSDEKELDWQEYEAITKYIYEALGVQYGIKIKDYGPNCKIKGKSGVEHQIDVLTEQFDGERQLLTAIECKYCKKKVNKDVVMKLSEIMQDSGIASGIIVCKMGFTKDTHSYAEHKGIKLVELREAEEDDVDFMRTIDVRILNLNAQIMISRGNVISIDFGSIIITGKDEIMQMYYTLLHDSHGTAIPFSMYLKSFSEEVQRRGELFKIDTINYPLSSKLFWMLPGKKIPVEKISITGFLIKIDRSSITSFLLTDQVWLIMKELFENRKLALSKSGLIWNLPPK